jgi:hypothetical protein
VEFHTPSARLLIFMATAEQGRGRKIVIEQVKHTTESVVFNEAQPVFLNKYISVFANIF